MYQYLLRKEAENTNNNLIKEMVYTSPLSLLKVNNSLIEQANRFLPYSIGFEIECFKNESLIDEVIKKRFKSIPDIMDFFYSSNYEYRFRIPNGVKGMICLFNILEECKKNLIMNLGSGIHIHVDCTDIGYTKLHNFINIDENIIKRALCILDTWEYKGEKNSRKIGTGGSWMKINSLTTLEFRCAEMSFSYDYLIKCMIDASFIVLGFKSVVTKIDEESLHDFPEYDTVNVDKIKNYLIYKEKSILKNNNKDFNKYKNIIKSRLNHG